MAEPAPSAPLRFGPMGVWAVALVALTAALGAAPSARVLGDDRVPDPIDDPSGWRLRGDDGGIAEVGPDHRVHLVSRAGQRAVAWYDLGDVGDWPRWRLRGRVKAPRPASVKVVLAATDGDRRLWFGSYGFESDDDTDIDVPVNAPLHGLDVSVGVLLRGEAGEAWLSRMELVPVAPRWDWLAGLALLAVAWIVWWVALVRRVGMAVGGLVLAIAGGVTLPRAWVDLVLGRFAGIRLFESPVALWIQKIGGHAGTFGLLGAALTARFGPRTSMGIVAVLAVASEALQLVSVARSASLYDVLLDVVGGAIGVGAVTAWRAKTPR